MEAALALFFSLLLYLISVTHAYDLGFLKWEILIFAVSLESGFMC